MLKTKHLFPFLRMVKALNFKEELKSFARAIKDNPDLAKLDDEKGMDFFFIFMEKLPAAEKEVIDFLAVFTGKTVSEVKEMGIEEIWSDLKQIFMDPKLKSFFMQALK